ncbi:MAG: c-type cytochrome, partial [Verrucomicrobiales bacterium]
NGRQVFGAANCFACHRFNEEGGIVGPDLTSVAGKFSPVDLLESIIEPSKEISDQYGAMVFELNDGSQVAGRIGNLSGDNYQVCTNMFEPSNFVSVPAEKVKSINPSPISMMPPGLLYTLKKDDVLDLLAYLLSKGNPDDPMFH